MMKHRLENRRIAVIRALFQIFHLTSFQNEFRIQSLLLPSPFIQQSNERGFSKGGDYSLIYTNYSNEISAGAVELTDFKWARIMTFTQTIISQHQSNEHATTLCR